MADDQWPDGCGAVAQIKPAIDKPHDHVADTCGNALVEVVAASQKGTDHQGENKAVAELVEPCAQPFDHDYFFGEGVGERKQQQNGDGPEVFQC